MSRRRPPLPLVPCLTCSAEIRRARPTWAICSPCMALAEAAFRREHPYADPITWSRDRSQFFTDRETVLAAIVAERAAQKAVA